VTEVDVPVVAGDAPVALLIVPRVDGAIDSAAFLDRRSATNPPDEGVTATARPLALSTAAFPIAGTKGTFRPPDGRV
jgi:hypothetical protein